MRTILILLFLAILLVGCESQGDIERVTQFSSGSTVDTIHDSVNNVTCWVYKAGYAGGIDCIPDWQLTPPD